jgi:anti-sigma regulatory factor (Ser/Thr protein kinase)
VRPGSSYRHEAFFYGSDDEYLAGTMPMIRGGLEAGEAVMVAVPPRRLDLLRDALGAAGDDVRFVDMTDLGRNPANIIGGWASFLESQAASGRPLRGIGEPVWPGRSGAEIAECQLHEALLNLAVAPATPLWLRCPYDMAGLDDSVLAAAHRSHPLLSDVDTLAGSLTYGGAHHASALLAEPLPEPAAVLAKLSFGRCSLRQVRTAVNDQAADAELPAGRTADLALAVHELATNSVRHGGGTGTVRFWRTAEGLTCEVADAGVVADPLVGRRGPAAGAEGGRGVWMANQLCDLVQLRTSDAGTTVRVLMRTVRPR